MSNPNPPPKYIYKILPSTPAPPLPPNPLPISLPISSLDARDGFIHMSTSIQILGTLRNFFRGEREVWIARVDLRKLMEGGREVKWEDAVGKGLDEKGGCWDIEGKAGYFPHIYGENLRFGRAEIESVGKWERVGEEWGVEGWPFGEDVPRSQSGNR